MERILISACLVGRPVRYNGTDKPSDAGRDVSALYVQAAYDTVAFARRHGCRHAVLTDGSPSCGSTFIYDGTFSGTTKPGMGATTAALRDANVHVWPETAIAQLDPQLRDEECPH